MKFRPKPKCMYTLPVHLDGRTVDYPFYWLGGLLDPITLPVAGSNDISIFCTMVIDGDQITATFRRGDGELIDDEPEQPVYDDEKHDAATKYVEKVRRATDNPTEIFGHFYAGWDACLPVRDERHDAKWKETARILSINVQKAEAELAEAKEKDRILTQSQQKLETELKEAESSIRRLLDVIYEMGGGG